MTDRSTFRFYREIIARRSGSATCQHGIEVGDRIGWNPRTKATQCRECWDRWIRENQAADFDEHVHAGY